MKKALKQTGRFLPADAKATKVVEPADGAFDGPTPLVTTKRATVLGDIFSATIGAMWCNYLYIMFRKGFFTFCCG